MDKFKGTYGKVEPTIPVVPNESGFNSDNKAPIEPNITRKSSIKDMLKIK